VSLMESQNGDEFSGCGLGAERAEVLETGGIDMGRETSGVGEVVC